jgi:hypothetical protein
MFEDMWDVKDRAPIEMPDIKGNSDAALMVAVRAMPLRQRERFLRAVNTANMMRKMIELGINFHEGHRR